MVKPVYHQFAGDENVPYTAVMEGSIRWRAITEYASIAAEACGINVSPQTKELWFRMWAYAGLLDKLLDDQPNERRDEAYELYQRLLRGHVAATELPSWANPALLTISALCDNALAGFDNRAGIERAALNIAYCGRLKANSCEASVYAEVIHLEAQCTADGIVACLSPDERQSPGSRRLRVWLGYFTGVFCFRDSLTDLADDYRDELTRVVPREASRRPLRMRLRRSCIGLLIHPKMTLTVAFRFHRLLKRLRAEWVLQEEAYAE